MFGLFNSSKRVGTEAAVVAVRALLGPIQANHGLPSWFWNDPYILGFVHQTIGLQARVATRGKVRGATLGYVLADVLTTASNLNGAELARRATALAVQEDRDFARGGDDAAIICLYGASLLKNESNYPLVQQATQMAEKIETDTTINKRSQIVGMMIMLSIVKEVQSHIAQERGQGT